MSPKLIENALLSCSEIGSISKEETLIDIYENDWDPLREPGDFRPQKFVAHFF